MNVVNKHKYKMIFIICLLIMISTVLNEVDFYYIVKNYLFNADYQKGFFTDGSHYMPYSQRNLMGVINDIFNYSVYYFDTAIITGTQIFQIIIPLFPVVASISLYKDRVLHSEVW